MKKNTQQEQMRQIMTSIIWGFLDWAQNVKGLEAITLYQTGVDRLQLIEEYQHYQEQAILGEDHESA